ncbi:ribokinase [uncultured Roseibium sp.]|uniref:ribokinase n=1 Tax=uncultured Roseibium sp. TaxID=1936171 RepID=UPI002629A342|nr:ribokinase [uncultured Roseibium sp.]
MITVFGSINLDLVVVVQRLPTAGETVRGPDHQTFPGGKGANQALAAKRAGANVAMVGAIGQDAFGTIAVSNMQDAGVDLAGVRKLPGATGLALIGIDAAGENQIIVASGANARVEAQWVEPVLAAGGTLLLQGEVPFAQMRPAIGRAKAKGAKVIWNPAPVPEDEFLPCLNAIDTLIVNESEAAEIAGRAGLSTDLDMFIGHFATSSRSVVVTLGSKGVLAGQGGNRYCFGAPAVSAVDTTGAGDAFCGALAASLDNGKPFERALKEGVAAGALACTATGAQSSAPEQDEIARLADQIF